MYNKIIMKKILLITLTFLFTLFIFSCNDPIVVPDEPTIENPVDIFVIWDNGENDYEPIEGATIVWFYEINSTYIMGDTIATDNTGFITADILPTATKIRISIVYNQMVGNVIHVAALEYTMSPCFFNNFNNPINNNNKWGINRDNHYFIFGLNNNQWVTFASIINYDI